MRQEKLAHTAISIVVTCGLVAGIWVLTRRNQVPDDEERDTGIVQKGWTDDEIMRRLSCDFGIISFGSGSWYDNRTIETAVQCGPELLPRLVDALRSDNPMLVGSAVEVLRRRGSYDVANSVKTIHAHYVTEVEMARDQMQIKRNTDEALEASQNHSQLQYAIQRLEAYLQDAASTLQEKNR